VGSKLNNEVKVTRKYQVTIPESVRSELGIKIGDKLIVKSENKRIVMESPKRVSNPSDTLWCLFGESMDVDAVKLVEESLESARMPPTKRKSAKAEKNELLH
jgi:antitoxin PrlF